MQNYATGRFVSLSRLPPSSLTGHGKRWKPTAGGSKRQSLTYSGNQRFEFDEPALQVPRGHEPRQPGNQEEQQRAHQIKTESVRRVRLHHAWHALVEHGDSQQNANRPGHPRRDAGKTIEQTAEKKRAQTVCHGAEG